MGASRNTSYSLILARPAARSEAPAFCPVCEGSHAKKALESVRRTCRGWRGGGEDADRTRDTEKNVNEAAASAKEAAGVWFLPAGGAAYAAAYRRVQLNAAFFVQAG